VPETWLDADKIDQILGNLVENAIRHGAGIVTIVVEPARMDGEAALSSAADLGVPDAAAVSVRDQGEGISPEVAPRVFRRFRRGATRHSAVDVGCHRRSFGKRIRRNPSRAEVFGTARRKQDPHVRRKRE